jgi:hypothetical protein
MAIAKPIEQPKRKRALLYGPDAVLKAVVAILRERNPDIDINLRSTDIVPSMYETEEAVRRFLISSPQSSEWLPVLEKDGDVEVVEFNDGKLSQPAEPAAPPMPPPEVPYELADGRVVDRNVAMSRGAAFVGVDLAPFTALDGATQVTAINAAYGITEVPLEAVGQMRPKRKKGRV